MIKKLLLFIVFTVLLLPLHAQMQEALPIDTLYRFRFVKGKDMFFVPYHGNDVQLDSLLRTIGRYRTLLQEGKMYISVSSYAATPGEDKSAARMAYIRNNRVKGELVTRGEVTEEMFVTDKVINHAWRDSLFDVVIVTFPASVEKVERIVGKEAAERVRTYIREIELQQQVPVADVRRVEVEQNEAERCAAERNEAERFAVKAERQRTAVSNTFPDTACHAESIPSPVSAFSLRFNLLRWATLTADLGLEYRIDSRWAILADGTFTNWGWKDKTRRYRIWKISPEARYYLGKERHGFLGAMYHFGEFNYKLGETGKRGNYQGGGITGGYLLPLTSSLNLDFHAALGYTNIEYDQYTRIDGVNVRENKHGRLTKNYWGINQLGISLVWKL